MCVGGGIERRFDFLLPVGISFYTFQALSYTLDIYKGEINAEKNIFKYALFVSFFPQLVAGPIERSKNLLPQIQKIEEMNLWNFERIRDGFFLMIYGLFQKLVIADRASMVVDNIINNYVSYGFIQISVAIFLFAFQIYCDFGGYSNIARGAAQVMGFSLMYNFKQPYLAKNIKEFWRRWHISLTTLFTDYIYIPLGGNRKGNIRKYMNTAIVFCVSGLWHGASWNFVVWGAIHAGFQIAGDLRMRVEKKLGLENGEENFSMKVRKIIGTFILVDFAWIFFVSNSLKHALCVIRQMLLSLGSFSGLGFVWEDSGLGYDLRDWLILLIALIILFMVDLFHERGKSIFAVVQKQEIWFRWSLYFGLIWGTIMLGVYGIAYDTSNFIYFQF